MNLEQLRVNAGFSRAKIANKIGISPNYLYMIEKQEKPPSYEVADKLAAFFDVPVEDLFPRFQRLSPHKV